MISIRIRLNNRYHSSTICYHVGLLEKDFKTQLMRTQCISTNIHCCHDIYKPLKVKRRRLMKEHRLVAMWRYVSFTYLLFWVMVLGICGTASMVFHASGLTMRWLANLCAWSPTITLLIMFKKLKPNMTLIAFYKQAFRGKIQLSLLLISACSVIGGTLLSVWALSIMEQKNYTSFFSLGMYSLPLSLILSMLSGPTGEESGWRGYLRDELELHYGFIKSALLLGTIWAFWHAVLWFVDSDFAGWSLIPYIFSNVIVMTSLTIIMNVVLKISNNLFYAI